MGLAGFSGSTGPAVSYAAVFLCCHVCSRRGALSHGGRSQGRSTRLNLTFLCRQTVMKTEWLSMHVADIGEGKGQYERKIVGVEVNIKFNFQPRLDGCSLTL